MSAWFTIFLDALWDASILPYGSQNSFHALVTFYPTTAPIAILVAIAGSALAYVINWFVGGWMMRISLNKQSPKTLANYETICLYAKRYGWVALLLVWIPLGNYITFLAGFFKVKLQYVLMATIPAIAAYYIQQAGLF